MRTAQYSAFSWWKSLHRTVTQSQVKQDRSSALRICVYLCTSLVFFCINTAERRWPWGSLVGALGEPWGGFRVALGRLWGGFRVAIGCLSTRFEVALGSHWDGFEWLCAAPFPVSAFSISAFARVWLWGGFDVALGGFAAFAARRCWMLDVRCSAHRCPAPLRHA